MLLVGQLRSSETSTTRCMLARMEFLLNTLEEVTRRTASAAANVDYRDAAAIQNVEAQAVFRTSSGTPGATSGAMPCT